MNDDPARARFLVISIHRFIGAGLVLLGILVTQRALDWPEQVGWVLIALGLADVFVVPRLLAKRWRTRQ